MSEVPASVWNAISIAGVLVMLIISVARGWLVPKYLMGILKDTYKERLADKDQQIVLLLKANEVLESAIQLQSHRLDDLVASQVATREVLESLKRVADAGTREVA